MNIRETLITKISSHALTMDVCGLGCVGLPLAADKARHGFRIIGFYVQQRKLDLANAKKGAEIRLSEFADKAGCEVISDGLFHTMEQCTGVREVHALTYLENIKYLDTEGVRSEVDLLSAGKVCAA